MVQAVLYGCRQTSILYTCCPASHSAGIHLSCAGNLPSTYAVTGSRNFSCISQNLILPACAENIFPTHAGRFHKVQKFFLDISHSFPHVQETYFQHMQEDITDCRNTFCTSPIYAGRMLPTHAGSMFPALWKVQEEFYSSGSIFFEFHPHLKKTFLIYMRERNATNIV